MSSHNYGSVCAQGREGEGLMRVWNVLIDMKHVVAYLSINIIEWCYTKTGPNALAKSIDSRQPAQSVPADMGRNFSLS